MNTSIFSSDSLHLCLVFTRLFSLHFLLFIFALIPSGHFACVNQSLPLVAGMVCGFVWMWPQSRENGGCEHLSSDRLQRLHRYSFHKPH